jgi:hypothetical protein
MPAIRQHIDREPRETRSSRPSLQCWRIILLLFCFGNSAMTFLYSFCVTPWGKLTGRTCFSRIILTFMVLAIKPFIFENPLQSVYPEMEFLKHFLNVIPVFLIGRPLLQISVRRPTTPNKVPINFLSLSNNFRCSISYRTTADPLQILWNSLWRGWEAFPCHYHDIDFFSVACYKQVMEVEFELLSVKSTYVYQSFV